MNQNEQISKKNSQKREKGYICSKIRIFFEPSFHKKNPWKMAYFAHFCRKIYFFYKTFFVKNGYVYLDVVDFLFFVASISLFQIIGFFINRIDLKISNNFLEISIPDLTVDHKSGQSPNPPGIVLPHFRKF